MADAALESTVALAAAAAATTTIKLGFGVMVLPLRPVAWVAKQVAALQLVSGAHVLLGVGTGGDRHALSWSAAGVSPKERRQRVDEALQTLPSLISGKPTKLEAVPGGPVAQFSPSAPVPPIVVGGNSETAIAWAARYGDSWFPNALPARDVAEAKARLDAMAAAHGRQTPSIMTNMMVALSGDPALPGSDALVTLLTDPEGMYGIPASYVPEILVTGSPRAVAARLAEYGNAGVERVVVAVAAGDWCRQVTLLAEAHALTR